MPTSLLWVSWGRYPLHIVLQECPAALDSDALESPTSFGRCIPPPHSVICPSAYGGLHLTEIRHLNDAAFPTALRFC